MMNMPKAARGVAALIVLAVVVMYASGVVGRYRTNSARDAGEATSTVKPNPKPVEPGKKTEPKPADQPAQGEGSSAGESEAVASGPVVIVKVDGLNFRREPRKGAEVIRGLSEGERLKLLKTEDGWHYAEDSSGETGWLYASSQYSTVEE